MHRKTLSKGSYHSINRYLLLRRSEHSTVHFHFDLILHDGLVQFFEEGLRDLLLSSKSPVRATVR